jgi:hypothetical protein
MHRPSDEPPGEHIYACRDVHTRTIEWFSGNVKKIERANSVVVLATLITVGRVVMEYGTLMAGLRESARATADRLAIGD